MALLDDIGARPGSTTSYLGTIVGLYLRRLDGWVSIAALISLMEDLGTPAARTRTAVARLKQKELLLPERRDGIGYRVNPDADAMLTRGDQRIFTVRQMAEGDLWCLVSLSIPESHREVRHQLRRRLQWIGCGVVSPTLWIAPEYLTGEVERILGDVGLLSHAAVFRAEAPRVSRGLPDAVASWWDLDAIRAEHESFQKLIAEVEQTPETSDQAAFVSYVRLVDAWRVLPYIDPGLPPSLLPEDWPGQRSFDGFLGWSSHFSERAWAHVNRTASAS